ncbi:MAG: integrase core domain-containing protein [Anaerolineales bacterium]
MRIVGLPSPFYYASQIRPVEMSENGRQRLWRLKAWERLRAEGFCAQKAADILKVPRSTLYRWQKRVDQRGLIGLEDGDRRPKRVRRPQWSPELAEAVLALRERHPGMGKEKLWVLLRRQGMYTSISTVGRILKRLKARGVLREPPRNGITKRKRRLIRPYATRKPKSYQAKQPGDLVQVDTLDVRPLPNVHFKQFTARDMVSRWDVVEAYRSATARNASSFLDTLIERSPYPVKAVQVDGGSEFQADFELACAEKGIRLFVLPPRSPKLNGHVERAQRTHTEEFYDLYMGELDLKSVNAALREWEDFYNAVRPHHSLDLRTPAEYLYEDHSKLAPIPKPSHMS